MKSWLIAIVVILALVGDVKAGVCGAGAFACQTTSAAVGGTKAVVHKAGTIAGHTTSAAVGGTKAVVHKAGAIAGRTASKTVGRVCGCCEGSCGARAQKSKKCSGCN